MEKECWYKKGKGASKYKNVNEACFGSMFHKHVSDARRKKLDDKSESMILVGYHKTRAYRLFNSIIEKLMISIYISIYGNEAWNWASDSIPSKPLMNSSLEEFDGELGETLVEEVVENVHDFEYVLNERPHRKEQF